METIKLAHYYESAFNRDQLYNYLRIKLNRKEFESVLDELIQVGTVTEQNGFIFNGELQEMNEQRREWSKHIFEKNKFYMKLIELLPWIKFVGLTGSNAFESCNREDDLDIFIISQPDRLWLSYFYIILIGKLFRKRQVLCVNYLVDENNLNLNKKTYFTAVQLIQMRPVYKWLFKQKLIDANPWTSEYLPNVNKNIDLKTSDQLNVKKTPGLQNYPGFLQKLNTVLFKKYYKRIAKKFPEYLGSSLILKEGIAKLHHFDNHKVYDALNATGNVHNLNKQGK